jgi:cytochrome c peroxidase
MSDTFTPSRRNASVTAPWLHDGTAATLPEVVRAIARYQNVSPVVRFLSAVAGEAARGGRVSEVQSVSAAARGEIQVR